MLQRKPKQTTKAKIDRMVADGARNYPAYLKLIYTGESELSSEDESSPRGRVEVNLPNTSQTACQPLVACFDFSSVNDLDVVSPGTESAKLKDDGRETVVSSPEYCKNEAPTDNGATNRRIFDDKERQKEDMEKELFQIQEEIASLRSLLETKLSLAQQLKRKLGLTPMSELKSSIKNLKHSETFLKTNAALRSLSNMASKTIGNWRNIPRFASPFSKHSPTCRGTHIKASQSLGNVYAQSEAKMFGSEFDLKSPSHN